MQQGYNLFKVWFAEAPESGVATDYGVWSTACAWAQYDAAACACPLGPELTLDDANFVRRTLSTTMREYLTPLRRVCAQEAAP